MTQISTLTPQGPSAETLDYLRKFARSFTPQRRLGKHILLHEDSTKALGEC